MRRFRTVVGTPWLEIVDCGGILGVWFSLISGSAYQTEANLPAGVPARRPMINTEGSKESIVYWPSALCIKFANALQSELRGILVFGAMSLRLDRDSYDIHYIS